MKALRILLMLSAVCAGSASGSDFVHPGGLNSRVELDFVKGQIMAGVQPWKGECDRLKNSACATRVPHGLEEINLNNHETERSRDDAIAAYPQLNEARP